MDEQKLLSSLNTLGYIEFDTLCDLSSLEEKFKSVELPWLSRCTYHMVHRVYICSNLNSLFSVHQYDQIEGCNIYNNIMWRFPSFGLKKQVKFQEGEHCWLLPTTCPPTKLKSRTVCCQEGEDDEDMTPSDMIIDYKVRSLLPLHSDLWYNSLGSTFTWHYLIVGTNVKLNFRFVGKPIVNYCEGYNSVIRSAIEVHELLMESLFDKHSNKSSPTSISRQGLQIIKTFHHCFCRELRRCHGPNIHPWDPGPSWSTVIGGGRHTKESLGRPPP